MVGNLQDNSLNCFHCGIASPDALLCFSLPPFYPPSRPWAGRPCAAAPASILDLPILARFFRIRLFDHFVFCFSVFGFWSCFWDFHELFCCLACGGGIGLVCLVGFLFLLVLSCWFLLVLVMACPKSKFKNGVGKNFGMVFLGFSVVGKEIDRSTPNFRSALQKSTWKVRSGKIWEWVVWGFCGWARKWWKIGWFRGVLQESKLQIGSGKFLGVVCLEVLCGKMGLKTGILVGFSEPVVQENDKWGDLRAFLGDLREFCVICVYFIGKDWENGLERLKMACGFLGVSWSVLGCCWWWWWVLVVVAIIVWWSERVRMQIWKLGKIYIWHEEKDDYPPHHFY